MSAEIPEILQAGVERGYPTTLFEQPDGAWAGRRVSRRYGSVLDFDPAAGDPIMVVEPSADETSGGGAQSASEKLLGAGLMGPLPLHWIAFVVGNHHGIDRHDEPAIIAPTLAAIRTLLEAKEAFVGEAVPDGDDHYLVKPWEGTGGTEVPIDAALALIEARWKAKEGPPRPGDVVWVELTEPGRERALSKSF